MFEPLKGASAAAAEAARIRKESQFAAAINAEKQGLRVTVPDPQRPMLTTELNRFIAEAIARGSTEAAEVYGLACREFLNVTGLRYADQITTEHIARLHQALFARGMSIRTVNNRHASVKAFLRFLGHDTKALPKPPRCDKTLPEIYADDELDDLFEAVSAPRENLLYTFLLQTGLREQEAVFLEWTDIDVKRKVLKLKSKTEKWGFRLKDFEEREIRLPDDLLDQLVVWRTAQTKVQPISERTAESSLVFAKNGKPDGHMLRTLKRQVKAAGLNCGKCAGCLGTSRECERYYLHKFRATYCTKLLRSGMDIRSVQALMGHSDLESTMRYVRPADSEQIEARINAISWTAKIRPGAAVAGLG
jgi:integrase